MNNTGLESSLISTLKRYTSGRNNDVINGLESPELSALLVEKYAIGMVDAVRTLKPILGLNIDINLITAEADSLCRSIDPETEENRMLRYKSFSKLDLSKRCQTN